MANKLTRTERLLLYNQFKILGQSFPDSDFYQECCEILEHGWILEYGKLYTNIFDKELSEERTNYLLDVLTMHEILDRCYGELKDKSGIDEKLLRFRGFDSNHEADLIAYAEHLRQRTGWKSFLKDMPLEIHRNTDGRYRQMLDRWRKTEDKVHLTKEDIQRIIRTEQD